MKVATWNVNGIRARGKEVSAWAAHQRPEVLCLQELKATAEQLSPDTCPMPGYHSLWHGGPGGYSGVSVHVLESLGAPTRIELPFDFENRVAGLSLPEFDVLSVYAPNGGKDYEAKLRFWKDFSAWAAARVLQPKPLFVAGDLNITRDDLDVHPDQRDPAVIGQRPEERALFGAFLALGFVDSTRALYPAEPHLYSWWPYWGHSRDRNAGWRIDYVLCNAASGVVPEDSVVQQGFGTSDHAPVLTLFGDGS